MNRHFIDPRQKFWEVKLLSKTEHTYTLIWIPSAEHVNNSVVFLNVQILLMLLLMSSPACLITDCSSTLKITWLQITQIYEIILSVFSDPSFSVIFTDTRNLRIFNSLDNNPRLFGTVRSVSNIMDETHFPYSISFSDPGQYPGIFSNLLIPFISFK